MTELSPAAQAVLDTAAEAMECPDSFLPYERDLMAAALRAAAEIVVPENHVYNETSDGTMRRVNELWVIRRGLYAIAAELEGN